MDKNIYASSKAKTRVINKANITALDNLEAFSSVPQEENFFEKYVDRGNKAKYKLESILAEGGMGVVFSVIEQTLHRRLAMKELQPELRKCKESLKNFITESKIMAYLEHPNIMTLYEFDLHYELGIFFTMKKVRGQTLDDIIEKLKAKKNSYLKKYSTLRLLNIFRKVCDAVSYAHSKKVLHLDIKPENIMVGSYGEILLLDWGTATVFNIEQEIDLVNREFLQEISESLKNRELTIVGSPGFMSPEQTKGKFSLLDQTTDVFLLGATLYNLFTLELPYDGEDVDKVIKLASKGKYKLPDLVAPERQIPLEICQIINKAMSCKQTFRYQTVEELSKDIDKWLFCQL